MKWGRREQKREKLPTLTFLALGLPLIVVLGTWDGEVGVCMWGLIFE